MTLEIKAILILVAFCALGGCYGTYLVMSERAATREAQLAASFQQQKADAAASSMAKREAEWQVTQKAYQTQLSQIKTTKDVAKALAAPPSKLPALEFNPFEVKPAPKPGDPNGLSVDVPEKNIVPLYKNLLDCSEQHAALGKCQADLGDVGKERDAAKEQAKTWEKAAKGGSFLSRVWYGMRVGGCGALGTAPGLFMKRADIAAAGAAVSATGCAIALHR